MTEGSDRYVSFVTFRRNGAPVATPVWIAELPDGRLGFTTDVNSGKVKRLGHTERVTYQRCSMRGDVDEAAPVHTGTATVLRPGDADYRAVESAIAKKYGWQYRLVALGGQLKALVKRENHLAVVLIQPTT